MFKKGDIIVCKDNLSKKRQGEVIRGLTVGNEYEVLRDVRDGSRFVSIKNDLEEFMMPFHERFELKAIEIGWKVNEWKIGDRVKVIYPENYQDRIGKEFFGAAIYNEQFPDVPLADPSLSADMGRYNGRVLEVRRVTNRDAGYYRLYDPLAEVNIGWTFSAAWLYPERWTRAKLVVKGRKQAAKPPEIKVGDEVYVLKAGRQDVTPRFQDVMYATVGQKFKAIEVNPDFVILDNDLAYQMNTVAKFDPAKHKIKEPADLGVEIEKARKMQQKKHGTCASFVRIHRSDEAGEDFITRKSLTAPCHAAFAYNENKVLAAIVDFVGSHFGVDDKSKNTALYKKYIDYIVNRSPWALMCLDKDVDYIWNNGCLLDVKRSGNAVAGAAIAMRVGHEYNGIGVLDTFERIKQEGFSEHAAWLVAVSFTAKQLGNDYTLYAMDGGHHCMNGNLDTARFLSFMKNGYNIDELETTQPIQTHQRYAVQEPINRTKVSVKAPAGLQWKDFIRAIVKPDVVGEGWNKVEKYKYKHLVELAKEIDRIIKD